MFTVSANLDFDLPQRALRAQRKDAGWTCGPRCWIKVTRARSQVRSSRQERKGLVPLGVRPLSSDRTVFCLSF